MIYGYTRVSTKKQLDGYGVDYYNVLDVQPPKISLTSPTESTTVFSAGGTAIKFEGTISDDAKIESIKIVHLNPAAANPLENKLKFINPAEQNWQKPSDSVGNIVFDVAIPEENYDPTTKIYSYEVNKSLDLFDDLKIGPDKPLITQDFVILAVDESGVATTLPISVIGDSESPKLTIDSIELKDGDSSQIYNVIDGIIKLPVVKPTTVATINGTWSDNSTTHWNDIYEINDIEFKWLDVNAKDFVNFEKTGNTWEVTVNQATIGKLMPSPYRHKNLYLQWQNNEDKKLFKQNNVNSVPTFMVYRNGKPQPIANANGIDIYQYSGTNKQVIANIYHYLQINKPTEKQRGVTNE